MMKSRRAVLTGLIILMGVLFLPIFGVVTAQQATQTAEPTQPVIAATQPAISATEAPQATPESTQVTGAAHWSYTGKTGPENWGDLSTDYAACASGQQQSPIDILTPTSQSLPDIQFNYGSSALNFNNDGRTIEGLYDEGSTFTLDGTTYTLKNFEFHHPGEHTINGVIYPMELNLIHEDTSGNIAIISVLIQEGSTDNAAFDYIVATMPMHRGIAKGGANLTINATDFLPTHRVYYAYTGSLTTPPCTEGIKWIVMASPITLSTNQIDQFVKSIPDNARPIQPLNGRVIGVSSGS